MNRNLLLATLSLVLTFGLTADLRGTSIVYDIQSYPTLQSGLTLSGTITTDGKLGTLASADITGWTYTIANGAATDTESGTNSSPGFLYSGGLTATSSQLTLPIPTMITFEFELNLQKTSTSSNSMTWLRQLGSDSYIAVTPVALVAFGWFNSARNPPGLSLGGSTWTIAQVQSVPEPGTFTLALMGISCLAAVQWTRRRRWAASR